MREYRTVFLGLISLIGTAFVLAYLYYAERQHQLVIEEAARPLLDLEVTDLEAHSSGALEVNLYFCRPGAVSPDADLLLSEKRSVFKTPDVLLTARQIVNEVIKGPEEDERKTFSEDARLRQIYLLEDGTAIVDLSREASQGLVGGVTSELCALYSVARSLVENVKAIKRVRFVVEGQAQVTFAGHVSIRDPFM